MSETREDKVLFKCAHCENDDMKYFIFHSLEYQSEQFANSPYKQNWNRETTPKVPLGFHVRCAKCNKDTFIIPDSYNPTLWGNDIPQSCVVSVKFEKPMFSAIQYILTEEGFLDQVVLTANNEKLSFLTKSILDDKTKFSVIGKQQYEMLLTRGLKEVNYIEPVEEVIKNDVKVKENNSGNTTNNNNNKRNGDK